MRKIDLSRLSRPTCIYSVWHWYIGAKYQLRLALRYSLALVGNFAIENHAVHTRMARIVYIILDVLAHADSVRFGMYYADHDIPMYFSMFWFTPLDIDAVDAVASILPWVWARKLHPPPRDAVFLHPISQIYIGINVALKGEGNGF